MALSFSRKSSSSASKAPKPTPRRASSAGADARRRPQTVPPRTGAPAPSVKPRSAGVYAAPTKRTARSAVPKRTARSAVPKRAARSAVPKRPAAPVARPKRPAGVRAPRTRTATVPATPGKRSGAPAFRLPVPGRKAPAGEGPRARGALAPVLSALGAVIGRLPLPHIRRGVMAGVVAGVLALAIAAIVVVNSPLFAATDIQVNGSEHVSQEVASQLVDVAPGTTLFNVDRDKLLKGLQANPWVMDVKIERTYPHGLTITPVERTVKAIAYISTDDIAWAIGEDGAWIAPLSLSITVDADGNEIQSAEDGSLPEGAQQLSGIDAALAIAKRDGALLLTDVPADIEPKAGEPVDSEVVNAGLTYAREFSSDFIAQVKDLSISSVEAISANLTNGVEVSLGSPEDIKEKERVVTKLLSQETGVTYINVREPGAYTFRSAPA